MNKKTLNLIFGTVALVLVLILPFLTPYTALATEILIFALFASSYDLVLGHAGMLSFGHAAFFGVGAYATGLTLIHLADSVFLGLLMGILVSAVLALVVGYLSVRRSGIYFAIITLSFAQLVYFLAFKWTGLTGGDNGLRGVPSPTLGPIDLGSKLHLYYFVLAIVLAAVAFIYRTVHSPLGRTLQALRENRDRARSIGYDVARFRLIIFAISGGLSGLAGGLLALLLNFVPLDSLYWTTSGDVVVMTIVGGMGTIFGPMLGGAIIIFLEDVVMTWMGGAGWELIIGLVFIITVLAFREGIIGTIQEKLNKFYLNRSLGGRNE